MQLHSGSVNEQHEHVPQQGYDVTPAHSFKD